MEKHSYLMMLDNEHTVLNMLKQFVEMESEEADAEQTLRLLSSISKSMPNLVLMDIALPATCNKDSLEMIQNCTGTPVLKISAKCEIATLGEALGMILETNSSNRSLKTLDSMSILMSNIKKGLPAKFSEN